MFVNYVDNKELKDTTKFFKAAPAEGWGVKPVSLFAEDELPDSIMLVDRYTTDRRRHDYLTGGDITTWLEETWLPDWRRHDYLTGGDMTTWLEETWLPDWRRHDYLTGGDMTTWLEETWLPDRRRHAYLTGRDMTTWLEETWLPDKRIHDYLTGGDTVVPGHPLREVVCYTHAIAAASGATGSDSPYSIVTTRW
jgi:hypothetical protein